MEYNLTAKSAKVLCEKNAKGKVWKEKKRQIKDAKKVRKKVEITLR